MKERVCIVGIGLIESTDPILGISHKELLFQTTREAMDEAGIERKEIGSAFTASYDFLEGRSLSNQFTLDAIGGVMKPCDIRLGEDAIYSLFAGFMEIMANPSKIVVVGSVQKASERDPEGLGFQKLIAESMEVVFSRPLCKSVPGLLGLEAVLAAMEARAFMHRTGLSEEQIALVAAKNLKNTASAGEKASLDVKGVLNSELLSWPIRKATKAVESDAACTLVLASEKKAKTLAQKSQIFVNGIGWCSDQGHLALREPGSARETKWAAHQAYHMAGIRRPGKEIDIAEVSDWYAHRELMHLEALGLCPTNEMGEHLATGVFEKDGAIPVNVSGGLLGRGNAIGTSGLIRVAQVAQQLRGESNGNQVPGAAVGLAHSWGGPPAATAGVAILGKV